MVLKSPLNRAAQLILPVSAAGTGQTLPKSQCETQQEQVSLSFKTFLQLGLSFAVTTLKVALAVRAWKPLYYLILERGLA